MTELFSAAHHDWTEDGTKPLEWIVSEGLDSFKSKIDQEKPIDYEQYGQTLLTQLRAAPKWQWALALDHYFLQDDRIFDFWTKDKVRNHGIRHAQHMLHFSSVMNIVENLDEKDSLILLLAACLHDIARHDQAAENKAYGQEAVDMLYAHYHLAPDASVTAFTNAFVMQSLVLVNSQSNYPMPELRPNDVHVLLDILTYFSLDAAQAEIDFNNKYNDRAAGRRLHLLCLLKDCDILDRLHFKDHLDVHYLKTATARCSLRISAEINGLS